MHQSVIAAKGLFVFATGFLTALASGNVHAGITTGQLVSGGGGIILGLAILKATTEIGKVRQMVDNHEDRLSRIERNEDKAR